MTPKGMNISMSRIFTTFVNVALDLPLIFLIYILIKLFILKEAKKKSRSFVTLNHALNKK